MWLRRSWPYLLCNDLFLSLLNISGYLSSQVKMTSIGYNFSILRFWYYIIHPEVTMGLRISQRPNGLWYWNCRYLVDSLIKLFHQAHHWSCTRSLIHIMQSTTINQFSRVLHTWIEIIPNHSIYHQAQSTYQAWVFLYRWIRMSL